MAWTQATINNLKPTDKNYKKQEDNLVVMITPAGSITYYAYIRRNLEYLGTHPELTLRNAKKKKLDMFADMYMGKHEESKMTFEEFVFSNDFQEWSIGHRKTHVARMNSMIATILPKLGKVKLAKINKVDINRYKNARLKEGVKHSTINRELSDISGVLTQAFEMEYINLPIKVQKFPEDRGKERRVLDDWEVKALRDSAHSFEGLNTRQAKQKKHIGLVIDIALWCGLRKGEILKLKREDIDFSKATAKLIETKNGSSRVVGLSPRVVEEMKKLPINIDGRIINCPSVDNFFHFYSQLQRWTGVKKSFHTTRHTFATRCAMKGWSIAEISAQGGWKNFSVLKRYTHLAPEYLAKKLGS